MQKGLREDDEVRDYFVSFSGHLKTQYQYIEGLLDIRNDHVAGMFFFSGKDCLTAFIWPRSLSYSF